jgi:hypothetical protein
MGSLVLENYQKGTQGLWIIKFPDFHESNLRQQLYIIGKKIILDSYRLVGKGTGTGVSPKIF